MINVTRMLEETAGRFPDKIAYSDPESRITFRELLDATRKIASRFLSEGLMNGSARSVLFYMEKSTSALPMNIYDCIHMASPKCHERHPDCCPESDESSCRKTFPSIPCMLPGLWPLRTCVFRIWNHKIPFWRQASCNPCN